MESLAQIVERNSIAQERYEQTKVATLRRAVERAQEQFKLDADRFERFGKSHEAASYMVEYLTKVLEETR